MKSFWLPSWAWLLVRRHLSGKYSRPAVRWMNRFAFFGVAVGVFAWISVLSIMNGLQGDIRSRVLEERAHLLWEGPPRSGLGQGVEAFRRSAGAELKSVRLLLQTEGLLEVPTFRQKGRISGSGVILQGIPDFPAGGAQIGSELAEQLSLGSGDEIKLRSAWKLDGAPLLMKVSGIFETGVPDLDRSGVRVNRDELENWLGLSDAVSRIEIQFNDPMQAEHFVRQAESAFGVPFRTWRETHASLWYSLRIEKLFMTVVVFFVIVLAALAVHLAMSVRVAEKTREIGLMRGLGAPRAVLTRLFLTEGLLIGIGGALTGLGLSRLFCLWVAGNVRMPDFYYSTAIPVEWSWSLSLILVTISVCAAMLASLGPALRAGRSTAAEALRS